MNLAQFSANKEVTFIILLIIGLLVFATLLFFYLGKIKTRGKFNRAQTQNKVVVDHGNGIYSCHCN